MGRFLLRRLGLAVLTLILLSIIVFVGTHVLPGDVGRRILGPFSDARAVAQLDKELGTDRPLIVQYGSWVSGLLTGNLGTSLAFQQSVASLLFPAILIFAVNLKLLPVTAQAPTGSGLLTQFRYLILPAIPLVFVLFGYIARITRSGMIEALDADYTRTATLKGLPRSTVIRRHVVRNALLPTIAVVATQTGYLIGGLVAIVYLVATLVADIIYSLLNPRIRYGAAE